MKTSNAPREQYHEKLITPAGAAEMVQSGDMLTVSGGSMQPFGFLAALSQRRDLRRVTVTSAMSLLPSDLLVRQFAAAARGEGIERDIRWASFCVGPGTREGVASGVVDFVPISLQNLGRALQERRLDVLVIGSSGMDEEGNFNLGCNVDWMPELITSANLDETLVVVEVNSQLPRTMGTTTFPLRIVDKIVEAPRIPINLPTGGRRKEAQAIGGFLNALVPDGATLQLGIGDLVSQSAVLLDGKRDLGLHSNLIGDAALHLRDKGALTGKHKKHFPGRWVGSFLLGSRKLYEFVNDNPVLALHSCEFVSHPGNILRNPKVVSITQGVCVDLAGQVATQSSRMEFASHPGVQRAFHSVAAASRGGAGIVVVPSASASGKGTNVVDNLPAGTTVGIPSPSFLVMKMANQNRLKYQRNLGPPL
jgi:4-hydroxybutyrate CoA-transferase